MSDKILQSIFEFTKNYKDPMNNNPLDQKNSNIQIVEKDGNANVILSVTHQYLEDYQKLADIFKLKKLSYKRSRLDIRRFLN